MMSPPRNSPQLPLQCRIDFSRKLRPAHHWRHRTQNSLDVAPGLKAEHGTAVVEQIELDIEAPAGKLLRALRFRPRFHHPPAHDPWIDLQQSKSDVARECKILLEVARVEMIVEDAADAARLTAVRQEEIGIGPGFELAVIIGIMSVAGLLHRRVERHGV